VLAFVLDEYHEVVEAFNHALDLLAGGEIYGDRYLFFTYMVEKCVLQVDL
jgi:hypothetical protein